MFVYRSGPEVLPSDGDRCWPRRRGVLRISAVGCCESVRFSTPAINRDGEKSVAPAGERFHR